MNGAAPAAPACALCAADAGQLIWCDGRLRVVLADEPLHPGFMRVIWGAHVAEMTDLNHDDRQHLLDTVLVVEQALREVLAPDKINLASLGNFVPHLHWHVIARWRDDPQFPQAVWALPAAGHETALARRREAVQAAMPACIERIHSLLSRGSTPG